MSRLNLKELRSFDMLKEMGLTEYQALIYLSLLIFGDMSAKNLSELTGIPYPKVYTSSSELMKRGWMYSVGSRPAIFRANPIEEVVERLQREAVEKLEKLKETVNSDIEAARSTGITTSKLSYSYSKQVALRAIKSSIKSSRKDVCLMLSHDDPDLIEAIATASKGMSIRAVITERNLRALRERNVRISAKIWRVPFPISLIIVNTDVVFMVFGPLTPTSRNPYALEIRDRDLVLMAKRYFELSWHMVG